MEAPSQPETRLVLRRRRSEGGKLLHSTNICLLSAGTLSERWKLPECKWGERVGRRDGWEFGQLVCLRDGVVGFGCEEIGAENERLAYCMEGHCRDWELLLSVSQLELAVPARDVRSTNKASCLYQMVSNWVWSFLAKESEISIIDSGIL
ncbi:hypothetical protein Trydic_g10808 [Trypoxylus dichotomus]